MSDQVAHERLAALFHDGAWTTERRALGTTRRDTNPFMSANIVLILERCGPDHPGLRPLVTEAKARMAAYRAGHRAYYWPLTRGRSRISDAPLLGRLPQLQLSPDADDTCLVQLARRDAGLDDAICADLAHYRADGTRFRLADFQRRLGAEGSFLTWFPEPERCRPGKLETVDVGVSANILWYLGATGRLATPGVAETIAFVTGAVRRRLVLEAPFRLSLAYPSPVLLLYHISRAAVWGNVTALEVLRSEILEQLRACPVRSAVEGLCRAATARLWNGAGDAAPYPVPAPDGRGAFYVAPFLAWPLQRWAALERLAGHRVTRWDFSCEALEWALYLWLSGE